LSVAPADEAAIILSRSSTHCFLRRWAASPGQVAWETSVAALQGPEPLVSPYASSRAQLLAYSLNLVAAVCDGAILILDATNGNAVHASTLVRFSLFPPESPFYIEP
jgi:hypothetical protein